MGKVASGIVGGLVGGIPGLIGGALLGKKRQAGPAGPDPYGTSKEQIDKAGQIQGIDRLQRRAQTQEAEFTRRGQTAGAATQGLIQDLVARSKGQGPSIAEAQLKQAQDRTLAQQLAATQAGRGTNQALVRRQALRQAAATQQDIAQAATQVRLQEQQQAQQLLGQVAGQESALAGQLAQQYLGQGLTMAEAQRQALLDVEKFKQAERQGVRQTDAAKGQAQAQRDAGIMTGITGAIGSIGAALAKSDIKAKKNIKSADKDVNSFLSQLKARSYNYKNETEPGTAPGKNYGVMAQDLEKSEMGKSLVTDTPTGKMVDTRKGFGAVLAAQANMHSRLNNLEKALKKKRKS